MVHAPYGIITVDDFVWTIRWDIFRFTTLATAGTMMSSNSPTAGLMRGFPRAIHVMGGNYTNQFHLLTDILPKMQITPLADRVFDGAILLPTGVTPPLRQVAASMARTGRAVYAPETQSMQIGELLFGT